MSLTKRQSEVLQLAADGHPIKGIALELGLSTQTVRVHFRAAYATLGVSTRAEAILLLGLKSTKAQPIKVSQTYQPILDQLLAAKSNRDIAETLGLHEANVRTRVRKVLQSVGAHNRAHIIAMSQSCKC